MVTPSGSAGIVSGVVADVDERLVRAAGGPARRRVIILLAAVLGLTTADTAAIGALAAPLESAFRVGNFGLGVLAGASTLAGAAATIPFGSLADRSNRVRVLQVTILTWGLVTLIGACSVSYSMFLGSRILLGAQVAASGPFVVSLSGDLFPAEERSRLLGFVLAGELIGASLGIAIVGALATPLGWRGALAVLALPAFFLAWALGRFFPEPARGGQSLLAVGVEAIPATPEDPEPSPLGDEEPSPAAPPSPDNRAPGRERRGRRSLEVFRAVLGVPTNVVIIVASALGYFYLQGLQTFAVLYLRDRFGLAQALASILFLVIAVGAIAGVVLGGRLADQLLRRGHNTARVAVAAVAFAASALVLAPGLLTTTLALSFPLFVLAAAALGAANPAMDAARLDVMPGYLWGRAEGIRAVPRTLLQGVAPMVLGAVSGFFGASGLGLASGIRTSGVRASSGAGHGLAISFLLLSALLVVAAGVLAWGRRHYLADLRAVKDAADAGSGRPGDGAKS